MEKFNTKKEAAAYWVETFNAIPMGVILKLFDAEDEIVEITPPGMNVEVFVISENCHGEITAVRGDKFVVDLDNGETVEVPSEDVVVEYYDYFPMWGTMWQFSDPVDIWWLEEKGGLQIMGNCGFRIYEQEDYGYIFGIDGAGYDFYEAHWIPLYDARGLKWHKEG